MKRMGDILKDMGFNANAPESTKKAFLKHLMKAAEVSVSGAAVVSNESGTKPSESVNVATGGDEKIIRGQLEFNFLDDAG